MYYGGSLDQFETSETFGRGRVEVKNRATGSVSSRQAFCAIDLAAAGGIAASATGQQSRHKADLSSFLAVLACNGRRTACRIGLLIASAVCVQAQVGSQSPQFSPTYLSFSSQLVGTSATQPTSLLNNDPSKTLYIYSLGINGTECIRLCGDHHVSKLTSAARYLHCFRDF